MVPFLPELHLTSNRHRLSLQSSPSLRPFRTVEVILSASVLTAYRLLNPVVQMYGHSVGDQTI